MKTFIESLENHSKGEIQIQEILKSLFSELGSTKANLLYAYFAENQEKDFFDETCTEAHYIDFLRDFDYISEFGANNGTHGLIWCDSMDKFFDDNKDDFLDLINDDEYLTDYIKSLDIVQILSGVRYEIVQIVAYNLAYELAELVRENYQEVAWLPLPKTKQERK